MTTDTDQITQARNLTPAELAAVVRTFREMRTWSQEQLAEIAGFSARTVQRVEEGQPSSLDTRRSLAGAFGFEDIDAFNKPYVIPTPEQMAAQKERFEKETVTLKVERVETAKQLARLAEGWGACLFTEGVDLSTVSKPAEELFAQLSDYCREYGDCAELYSASDKLAVYEELGEYLSGLAAEGVCLVAASRALTFRAQDSTSGHRMDILYVVAFPKDGAPEASVSRRQRCLLKPTLFRAGQWSKIGGP